LGIVFSLLGLVISVAFVRDTSRFTVLESKNDMVLEKEEYEGKGKLSFKRIFLVTSWKNKSLLAASQTGLVNNLIFGVTCGVFTIYFVSLGISVNDTAFLKALHPGVWGLLQLATGPLSDSLGRKKLIYPGMII